jgi:glycosyltransferase involved in cell wall biosynthesis
MKSVSIVIPTFNSMRTLEQCLDSIVKQSIDKSGLEIIFADAGSTDGTKEMIMKYKNQYKDINIQLFHNPLKTGEAGKAVGVKEANNEIIALIDSDNIIPQDNWMQRMLAPFEEDNIVGSEPIEYTFRKEDGYINRYCALIGMNDPLCIFTGNYDRVNLITNKWTEVPVDEIVRGDYISIRFDKSMIPTIGANGFFIRRESLLKNFEGDYLFDIDILWELLNSDPELRVAKVKTGIIHLFCNDISTFVRKQKRRIKDFIYFSDKKGRKYPWNKVKKTKLLKFIVYCFLIFPLIGQAIIGYNRKKDFAWLFHPIACWITLWVYGWGTIVGRFKKEMINRDGWKQ